MRECQPLLLPALLLLFHLFSLAAFCRKFGKGANAFKIFSGRFCNYCCTPQSRTYIISLHIHTTLHYPLYKTSISWKNNPTVDLYLLGSRVYANALIDENVW
ncbi:hypothetical protein L1887_13508 [Cichorium endivia]|nr:hypothetical protein L1887_13508 [Cichorium endivia]